LRERRAGAGSAGKAPIAVDWAILDDLECREHSYQQAIIRHIDQDGALWFHPAAGRAYLFCENNHSCTFTSPTTLPAIP
jgi:hypothetical protein